ncbi:MAG TPA: glycosyltransferase family 4 protein [Sphingobacterium sp.]|nr:glycosyltransferase family 4 protein [Sphingobacterium sp.]
MKKILIFTEYYYPGYKAGGPIQSVYNIANSMASSFEVRVVCRDRDSGDLTSYPNVELNAWNDLGDHLVYYTGAGKASKKAIEALLSDINPDVVYLNSFFSNFSSLIFRILLSNIYTFSVLIAPRGEFNEAALSIKKVKKLIYRNLFKVLLLRKMNIYWQATSLEEFNRITYVMGENAKKYLLQGIGRAKQLPIRNIGKKQGEIKIVTVSRIHRIKNLDFFLDVLKKSNVFSKITWDIFGLVENRDYQTELMKKAESIPNLSFTIKGEIPNEQIHEELPNYHLFVLPTLGENFGHAIYDAIIAGLPVLISDKTPWLGLSKIGVGFDISLSDTEMWIEKFVEFVNTDDTNYWRSREQVYNYGSTLINNNEHVEKYKQVFNQLSL